MATDKTDPSLNDQLNADEEKNHPWLKYVMLFTVIGAGIAFMLESSPKKNFLGK